MSLNRPSAPQLSRITHGLPDWWLEGGNSFWAFPDSHIPQLQWPERRAPPTNSRISLLSPGSLLKSFRVFGAGNQVEIGRDVVIEEGDIICGDGGRVSIGDRTLIGPTAWIDARNGGCIEVGADGLWSTRVRVTTDDMHAIIDRKTDRRINRRGASVTIDRHVWIGMEVAVLPGASIGEDTVIGIKSVVSGAIPPRVVAAGVPARVLREDVTWSLEDRF